MGKGKIIICKIIILQDHNAEGQDHNGQGQDHKSLGHNRGAIMIFRAEQDHNSAEQSRMGFLQDAEL